MDESIGILQTAVERHKQLIYDTLAYICANPETGYRETKTSKYLEGVFENLRYELVRAGDVPGFYTVIDTGRCGPEILVLGEMDALLCETQKEADPETGAVHCCGHGAQCAGLVGIAAVLRKLGVLDGLCGRIRLCAVPAEGLIELEYREELRQKGIIKYFGGKRARIICENYQAPFADKKDYLAYMDRLACEGDRIVYEEEEKNAAVKL